MVSLFFSCRTRCRQSLEQPDSIIAECQEPHLIKNQMLSSIWHKTASGGEVQGLMIWDVWSIS